MVALGKTGLGQACNQVCQKNPSARQGGSGHLQPVGAISSSSYVDCSVAFVMLRHVDSVCHWRDLLEDFVWATPSIL